MPVFIQAVPWQPERTKRAVQLMRATGGTVVWDESHSAWETWLKVLAAVGDEAGILLEDDVRLASCWRERVEDAVAARPSSVIRFFSQDKDDLRLGSRWRDGLTYYCNLCTYFPRGAAASLLEWIGQNDTAHLRLKHDHSVGEWLASRGERYWLHVPSLVQHEAFRPLADPRRPRIRQSPTFEEAD